ncbi:uncharacterized protein BO97DRAFT_407919 [Aspergillus homomorphus CBS 101889]|uniref:Uncharacterized protein n=1 Tax=Aspergillus homomorphus (strain CBS 101889) TaxID=1450537 RepID=A0A395HNM1_ASPHC|nr:hypothetical protein BO97DRAFT_407919 [Aspergillus homomorphus CBS 101889]RAL09216.1 hypothetical protein BO97DRAFT_407919 [Aspergillus homomorphus CBS 101889]
METIAIMETLSPMETLKTLPTAKPTDGKLSSPVPGPGTCTRLEDLPMDVFLLYIVTQLHRRDLRNLRLAAPDLVHTLGAVLQRRCLGWAMPSAATYERCMERSENGHLQAIRLPEPLEVSFMRNWVFYHSDLTHQPFALAILEGRCGVVRNVLDAGLNPHSLYDLYGTPFWFLVIRNRTVKMLELFLAYPGIDVNQQTSWHTLVLDDLPAGRWHGCQRQYPQLWFDKHTILRDEPEEIQEDTVKIMEMLLARGARFNTLDFLRFMVCRPRGLELLRQAIRNANYVDDGSGKLLMHLAYALRFLSQTVVDVLLQELPDARTRKVGCLVRDALERRGHFRRWGRPSWRMIAHMIEEGFPLGSLAGLPNAEFVELAIVLDKLTPNPRWHGSDELPARARQRWSRLAELLLARPELQQAGFQQWRDPVTMLKDPLRSAVVSRDWLRVNTLLRQNTGQWQRMKGY